MTGLYAHVPFCSRKCHYCDFVITTGDGADVRGRFLAAFEREAAHRAGRFAGTRFSTLYIGGGTPSRLDAAEAARFFRGLRDRFSFEAGAETTWEANPEDVTPESAAAWRALGVNRISLGAQTFDDATLGRLNRPHSSADTGRAVAALRAAGFDNVSLDVMIALPGQTREASRASIERAVELGPEHVSLYELTVEERTVFGGLAKKGKLDLPLEEDSLAMLEDARTCLRKSGYVHYELLSYAKAGRESRHNRIYWANGDYLGLGPGAYSHFDGRRFRGSASFAEYLAKCESGDWTARDEESLAPEAKEVESLLLALRLSEGAARERFAAIWPKKETAIRKLETEGLLAVDASRVRLTDRGRLFAETVFSELSL